MNFLETAVVIYLDEYRKAKATRTAMRDRHRGDRQCVNAGAIAAVSTVSCFEHPCEPSPPQPEDLVSVDRGKDLDRIQALATQF